MNRETTCILRAENNSEIIRDFYKTFLRFDPYSEKHITYGNEKNIRVARTLALMHPEQQIYCFDNNLSLWGGLWEGLWEKTIGKSEDLPDNLHPVNFPKGPFDSASFIFSIHDIRKKRKRLSLLERAYKLLRPRGKIVIMDYDVNHVLQRPDYIEELKGIFNTRNEQNIGDPESKDFEKDWVEAHTHYSLEQCVRELVGVGFNIICRKIRDQKLFLVVGEKSENGN